MKRPAAKVPITINNSRAKGVFSLKLQPINAATKAITKGKAQLL
jgi:hypothetical protein